MSGQELFQGMSEPNIFKKETRWEQRERIKSMANDSGLFPTGARYIPKSRENSNMKSKPGLS